MEMFLWSESAQLKGYVTFAVCGNLNSGGSDRQRGALWSSGMSVWSFKCVWEVCVCLISTGSGMDRETEREGGGRGGDGETRLKEEMMGAGGLQEITFSILDPCCMCARMCVRSLVSSLSELPLLTLRTALLAASSVH